MNKEIQAYYDRKEIQQEIIRFAHEREIAVRLDYGGYAKRPLMIQDQDDIQEILEMHPTSFHASEERWEFPHLLGELEKKENMQNCTGWDLVLDIDGQGYEVAQIATICIVNHLWTILGKWPSVKFSGNKGFHIGIPFEAFSEEILGIGKTAHLFPDVARKIAACLGVAIEERLSQQLFTRYGGLEGVLKEFTIDEKECMQNGKFHPFSIVEIDTILISHRHLFRMPYSWHEKSGLISIPVNPQKIKEFSRDDARPEKVDPQQLESFRFLAYDTSEGKYGDSLLVEAYDNTIDIERFFMKKEKVQTYSTQSFSEVYGKVDVAYYPETINYILHHHFDDGRKRLVFILISFFKCIGESKEAVLKRLELWQREYVKDFQMDYIKSQVEWFFRQERSIAPPNFSKEAYYRQAGVPDSIVEKDRHIDGQESNNLLKTCRLKLRRKKK